MNIFSWLHLTDIHCCVEDWVLSGMQDVFFGDLKQRYHEYGQWDVVLFSGDLTQRGTTKEFLKFADFLNELWEFFGTLGFSPKFLAVPGNHDLVRPHSLGIQNMPVKFPQLWHERKDIQTEFWEDEQSEYRRMLSEAFSNYMTWWRNQPYKPSAVKHGLLPGDFSASIEKNGIKVGVMGLNTSFLQLTNGDCKEKLALHARQFHQACNGNGPNWANRHHACLLLTHHPPAWLSPRFQRHVKEEITAHGYFSIHLCGHMHETIYRTLEEGGVEPRRIWQGRPFSGMESLGDGKQQHNPGYSIGIIKIKADNTGSLLFWPREIRLQGGQKEIIPDYTVKLMNDRHTDPTDIKLHDSHIGNNEEPVEPSLDSVILQILYSYFQEHSGARQMMFNELIQASGKNRELVLQSLFKLDEKGWLRCELTEKAESGSVWLTQIGIRVAKDVART